MSLPVTESGSFRNITATTTIAVPGLKLLGFLCNSSTSGTAQLSDGATAITGTISLTAGQFYPCPAQVATSLVTTIGGTANVTLFYSV